MTNKNDLPLSAVVDASLSCTHHYMNVTGQLKNNKHLEVVGGLLVKALDCGSKGPGFQSHLQQRFISLLGALSPTSKIE